MTAIVGVLNSRGIAIAADSAVTVSGKSGKKVYNRSNKLFTLSKYHPVGIAIYNSADFLGIPLETLIKVYRENLKDKAFNTLAEYKLDFLDFLKKKTNHISREFKGDAFYSFCFEMYDTIKTKLTTRLNNSKAVLEHLAEPDAITLIAAEITSELDSHLAIVRGYKKAEYVTVTRQEFEEYYRDELTDIRQFVESEIQTLFPLAVFNASHSALLDNVLFELINVEYIFENYSGLVFIGFGEEEFYPSSQQVLLGTLIADNPRIRVYESAAIVPGVANSNIIPYVQGDVTTAVLTGLDPNYKNEVTKSIRAAFDTISDEVGKNIEDPEQSEKMTEVLKQTAEELIQKMDDYQFKTITGPLLDILAHMGKEDMSELAESLVNITSLKRKFTSSDSLDESVGGPVDVAIITKGDGFIWMKLKQYFSFEDNRGFMDKYFK